MPLSTRYKMKIAYIKEALLQQRHVKKEACGNKSSNQFGACGNKSTFSLGRCNKSRRIISYIMVYVYLHF